MKQTTNPIQENDISVHYPDLLNFDYARSSIKCGSFSLSDSLQPRAGSRYCYSGSGMKGIFEAIMIYPGVMLLLDQCRGYSANYANQLVGGGGWMHLQFRICGSGSETLGRDSDEIAYSDGSCVITAYPSDALVTRYSASAPIEKTACLYMRPKMMTSVFGVPADALPNHLRWIVKGAVDGPKFHVSALSAASVAAVMDMLTCPFDAWARTAYLQAKSIELITVLLQELSAGPLQPFVGKLSQRDVQSITCVRDIIHERVRTMMTLDELAATVGINRSKLAVGFKRLFGRSVQVYSRDLRLSLGRDLLRSGESSVTDVAFELGYSEVSAFSRAFAARFGFPPKEVSSTAGGGIFALEATPLEETADIESPRVRVKMR